MLLFHAKRYKVCLSDIERALKITKSSGFKIELLCGKIECLANLGSQECLKVYREIERLSSELRAEDLECLREMLGHARTSVQDCMNTHRDGGMVTEEVQISEKKEESSPFDAVSVRESIKYGRHSTAKRDFKVGEIIYTAEPYLKVPHLLKIHIYCGHCLKVSWSLIPCDYCNWSMFCSDDCKKEAWEKYHVFECGVVAQLLMHSQIEVAIDHQIIAIRALMMGIKESGGIRQLKTKLEAIDNCRGEVCSLFVFTEFVLRICTNILLNHST